MGIYDTDRGTTFFMRFSLEIPIMLAVNSDIYFVYTYKWYGMLKFLWIGMCDGSILKDISLH